MSQAGNGKKKMRMLGEGEVSKEFEPAYMIRKEAKFASIWRYALEGESKKFIARELGIMLRRILKDEGVQCGSRKVIIHDQAWVTDGKHLIPVEKDGRPVGSVAVLMETVEEEG